MNTYTAAAGRIPGEECAGVAPDLDQSSSASSTLRAGGSWASYPLSSAGSLPDPFCLADHYEMKGDSGSEASGTSQAHSTGSACWRFPLHA